MNYESSNTHNGRISIDHQIYQNYNMFQETNSSSNNFASEAIKTIIQKNPVSDVFFSKANIDYLQKRIQQIVYERSNGEYQIGRQSDTELEIIMRSIYLQFSVNRPDDIRAQIQDLDRRVLDESIPSIMTGVQQYIQYTKDINQMYKPIDMPRSENSKGNKSLEYQPLL
jgi:hypothetical protein